MTHRSSSSEPTVAAPTLRSRRGLGMWVVISAWVGVTILGMAYLARYEHDPGNSKQAPPIWPLESAIELSTDRSTLLMFAHPKCPCSRASFDELERLLTDCRGRVDAHAIFVKPTGADDAASWQSTALWAIAERIPGVSVHLDEDGKEARRFAALTSGQVLLFNDQGELQFQGGITSSRGHSGDNSGRQAVVALIHGREADLTCTHVYGCELGTEEVETCCQP